MSIMNCTAALRAVLEDAQSRMDQLIVIRVDPDADGVSAASSRYLTLPMAGDAQFRFAHGCARASLLPVLDLTAVKDACACVASAVRPPLCGPFVIRACARSCPPVPGVTVIAPRDARECAGAMRYALQSDRPCLILENPLTIYEACEVPDDSDELFCGETLPPADECVPDESGDMAPREEGSPAVLPPGRVDAPVPCGEIGFRCRPYNPAELERTAELLNLSRDDVAALCCQKAAGCAEIVLEMDGEPGETAFIPPEQAACLWIGRDRMTLSWRTRQMDSAGALALLRETAMFLELPLRLILERK